jgi:hypothetical protein
MRTVFLEMNPKSDRKWSSSGTRRLLVVVAAVTLAINAGRAATPAPRGFGAHPVWRLSEAAVAELHGCASPIGADCVRKVMERHGASAAAFDFYRRTGWFLSELKDGRGPVMLATVVNPWRANENEQPALLGGNPAVVFPEEVDVRLENFGGFKALKARFPKVMFWKAGPTFESKARTAAGERFVFRYRLLDGCHACPTRGWARIAFDFAPDGTYRGAKVLGLARA